LPAACFNQYNVVVSPPDNQLNALQRKLELRDAELKEAHRHIAALKGKLLKLQEYRRELKQLKEERRRRFLPQNPMHGLSRRLHSFRKTSLACDA
jgi:chromosome segregation ATPase